ncbi:acyltransferase [Sinomonas sp. ASV486]|uniref:acyltransferase family protein n=1 Tax=Sinomonas sp. ASV486 TaxID=3051170 RepID=UPI0027DCDB8D|nr:acyltransferase [Sinomonas sp. ASV486]MDQ4488794.1 acyltransferase [Sinomonas sp. ASV486]
MTPSHARSGPYRRSPLPEPRPGRGLLSPSTRRDTLAEFGGNSLNALRLVFAVAVIVSHAWSLGGYGPEPSLYGLTLGGAAVTGFFAISGYLITLSAQRTHSAVDFFASRFARIYPPLIVAAPLVGFAAAAIGALMNPGSFDLEGAAAFIVTALTLLLGILPSPRVGTALQGNSDPLQWDGPLWTLTWEALCYVVIGFVVFVIGQKVRARFLPLVILSLLAIVTLVTLARAAAGLTASPHPILMAPPLIGIFLAGSLLALVRHHVPTGPWTLTLAIGASWAAFASGLGPALASLPLAYIVLRAGSSSRLSRIGARYDISYGLYIYGWPVQQVLALTHVPANAPPLAYAALALVGTWPLAMLSCVLVERPALGARKAWSALRAARRTPASSLDQN